LREDVPALLRWSAVGRQHCHTRQSWRESSRSLFGQSSFATYALVNERNVVKVSNDVPLERLGPLGCGIQTGAGAVMNALNVRPGTSFASFGAGAIGCAAIMAARVVGATTIVAIDIVPSRMEMAKELGATHAINSKQTNPVEAIRDITGGGMIIR
jgi:aryl-alcohol dehydrogenase